MIIFQWKIFTVAPSNPKIFRLRRAFLKCGTTQTQPVTVSFVFGSFHCSTLHCEKGTSRRPVPCEGGVLLALIEVEGIDDSKGMK